MFLHRELWEAPANGSSAISSSEVIMRSVLMSGLRVADRIALGRPALPIELLNTAPATLPSRLSQLSKYLIFRSEHRTRAVQFVIGDHALIRRSAFVSHIKSKPRQPLQ